MQWLIVRGPLGIPRAIWILLALDAGLGVAYLVGRILDLEWWEINYLVDLDGESNLPTWWSTVQLAGAAALMFVVVNEHEVRTRSRSWILWLWPALLVALSIDETARLHELVGRASDILLPGETRATTALSTTGIWVLLIGVPAAIVIAGLLVRVRSLFRRTPSAFTKVVVGTAMLLLGAVGVETLSNFVDEASAAGIMLVFLEEILEMVGVSIIIWAGFDSIDRLRVERTPG